MGDAVHDILMELVDSAVAVTPPGGAGGSGNVDTVAAAESGDAPPEFDALIL